MEPLFDPIVGKDEVKFPTLGVLLDNIRTHFEKQLGPDALNMPVGHTCVVISIREDQLPECDDGAIAMVAQMKGDPTMALARALCCMDPEVSGRFIASTAGNTFELLNGRASGAVKPQLG